MLAELDSRYSIYDIRCKDLLEEEDIRFAGMVDKDGRLVGGGFKKGIIPLESDEENLESILRFMSEMSLRNEYDASLGPINYLVFRRDKAVLFTFPFPLSSVFLLVSAEPNVDGEKITKKITRVFGDSSLCPD